jgi:hypothetical protein
MKTSLCFDLHVGIFGCGISEQAFRIGLRFKLKRSTETKWPGIFGFSKY